MTVNGEITVYFHLFTLDILSFLFMTIFTNEFSCRFGHNIISNGLYQTIRNNIVVINTNEFVLLFHKKTTKLVFLWPNMGQKSIKVLTSDLSSSVSFVFSFTIYLVKVLKLFKSYFTALKIKFQRLTFKYNNIKCFELNLQEINKILCYLFWC